MDQHSVLTRRDVFGLVVARVGRVVSTGDPVLPWVVLDGAGMPVGAVAEFLSDLLACGSSPASCRSYGFDLLRWFRFLAAVDVEWHRAKRGEVRDFVLWLRVCHNPARDRHRQDAPAPGAVNSRTGKASMQAGYAPATINHAVSVMSAFYDFHLLSGQGPVLVTRMVIVTGKDLLNLDLTDVAAYAQARYTSGRPVASLPLAYQGMHAVGALTGAPATLAQSRCPGKLTAAELVDRYPVADRAVHEVLVHYLAERAAVLDYGSLANQS